MGENRGRKERFRMENGMLESRIKPEWTKFLLPLGMVASGMIIRSVLIPGLRETPYVIFYPVVIISALYGGFWPGLAALALSGIAASTWFPPAAPVQFYIPGTTTGMLVFLAGGAIITAICSQLLKTKQRMIAEAERLRKSERSLEAEITEHKRTGEELKRLSYRNKLILESAGEGIWGVDTAGIVTFINKTGAASLGYDANELIGKPSHRTWHYKRPDGAPYPSEECPIYAAYKDGVDHTGEEMFWKKDGSGFHADYTSRPIVEGGRITGAVITFRDITDRKRAQETLKASEERLKRSQEIARLGSWELDIIKNNLTWSDEVYRIFGLEPREFKASYEAFLEAVHPDDRAAVDIAYSSSLKEGRDTYEIEHRVVQKSTGEIRYVHERCEHFRDGAGRVIRSAGMVHDITESKRAEEERERLLAELAALQQGARAVRLCRIP